MAALITLLAILVAVLGVLVAGLLRSHAEVLRALHELGVNLDPANAEPANRSDPVELTTFGVPRPRPGGDGRGSGFDIVGQTPAGDAATVAVTGTDRLTLVAFLSSTCLTCRAFWDAFGAPGLHVPGDARLVAVTKGADAESPAAVRKLAPRDVVTVLSSEAWASYGVPLAPYFVLVDGASGDVVGEGAATSWDQVRNLMEQSMADAGWASSLGRRLREGPPARDAHETGKARAARVDEELRAAGIDPGHPSLYPGEAVEG
jgi:hypothetical protein